MDVFQTSWSRPVLIVRSVSCPVPAHVQVHAQKDTQCKHNDENQAGEGHDIIYFMCFPAYLFFQPITVTI
jgi:hypothetical protein